MNQRDRIRIRTEIENRLQERLNYHIEQTKAGLATNNNTEIHNTIRAGVQESYQLAVDYVTQQRKTVGFLTSQDLEIIRQQTDDYVVRFQRKVDLITHRNDVLLQKHNYEPRSELNVNYMASVLAIGIVTTTMAKATLSKIAQLKSSVKSAAFGLKRFFQLSDIISGVPSSKGVPRDEFEDQVQWNATLDNRTCAYCLSLHGSFWYANDPNKPTPGDEFDVHPNCRCMWDYHPSILDIPMAVELANLARRGQLAFTDRLF
jgi:hypothetical protein